MPFETVLLALGRRDENRSSELAEAVVDAVGGTDTEVVLLHVFSESEFDDGIEQLDYDFSDRPDPDEVAERHTTVRAVADLLREAGVDYRVRGVVGNHGEEIVDVAEAEDAGMVFVGGSKRSPAGKAAFGDTAQYVLLNAPCPVTYVQGPSAD